MKMQKYLEKLIETGSLTKQEWITLLGSRTEEMERQLFQKAREIRERYYGKDVYVRGLIEFTNYCKNDCYYCGIRKSNDKVLRYRLKEEEILECCEMGYELGFRTFVLQGGEDGFYSEKRLADLIHKIRTRYPDCAITLSVGEQSKETYQAWFDAGADRYLLRHETANMKHYRKLHPDSLSLEHRKQCLWNLKKIGYEVGTGFMVGSPGQTLMCLAEDMMFIQELQPHMVGIGPFVSHKDTPFAKEKSGDADMTVFLLALLRVMLPKVLLPATTALGTIAEDGRQKGILAGANVVMPNLSPISVRKKYTLYENKACMGMEAAEGLSLLKKQMKNIGYEVVIARGDSKCK